MDDCIYVSLPLNKVVQLLRPIRREKPEVIHWPQYQECADQYFYRSINILMHYIFSTGL